MSAVGVGAGHLALLYAEVGCKLGLETGGIEGCKGGHLRRLEAGVEEDHQTGKVGRVEDDNDMLDIGAVLLDILSEVLGNLAVPLEKVFTGHAGLAGSSSGGDDIFCILEGDCRVGGPGDVCSGEGAVVHLGDHSLESGLVDVIQAKIRCKLEHHGCLCHVGTDHAGSSDDGQFVICQKSHD